MAKPKGSPRTGGRLAGTPNKLTAQVKDMIRNALDEAGGVKYLVQQSKDNPTAFLTLVGKLVPIDANVNVNDKRPATMTDDQLEQYISLRGGIGTAGTAKGPSVTH